jgi:glutamine cyclotransferase
MLRAAGLLLLMGTIGFLPGQRRGQGGPGGPLPTYGYEVVRSYPHDRSAFTQGLFVRNGFFYEGTGMNGQSGIRKVKIETGEVLQSRPLAPQYFGEGIVEWKGSIVQLTWQHGIGFVYDAETFAPTRTFTYRGEGWGITHDGTRLIMSDGTAQLRFLDPATLKETGRVTVRDARGPVENLNELELVKGEVFANVWGSERIARIAPADGRVTGWIDLAGLLTPTERANADVLNGIAYDAASDRLFVTGKWWPRVFEIKLVKK